MKEMNTKNRNNMKRNTFGKTRLLLGAALCAMAAISAGCGKDGGEPAPDAGTAVRITGGIAAQTRASDSSWDAGDQIGIYMYYAGTTDIAEATENVPYTTADGTSAFTPAGLTIYYPVDGSSVDFTAWSPYADVEERTADLTDQSSQEAIDLMTAEALSGTTAYSKENPDVALSFRHRLTKIVVNVSAGNGISESDLAGTKVQITQQVSAVTYAPAAAIAYGQQLATIDLLTSADGTFAEAILCPDDVATAYSTDRGRQLVFTLGSTGEIFYYSIDADKSFNAGEKNIYNITVNRVSLDVTATIVDWTDGNGGGEDGSAE